MGGCAGGEQKPPVKNQQGEPTIPKPVNSEAAKVTEPTKSSPANPSAQHTKDDIFNDLPADLNQVSTKPIKRTKATQ